MIAQGDVSSADPDDARRITFVPDHIQAEMVLQFEVTPNDQHGPNSSK